MVEVDDLKKEKNINPRVRDVLLLLGVGTLVMATVLMPELPMIAKPIADEIRKRQDEKQEREWNKYNPWRLKQLLTRLNKQKLVDIDVRNGAWVVDINERGKKKLLKYKLDDMTLKDDKWDGRWRIITYDIFSKKKNERELFRKMLKQLKFFQLQRSVYITPYECSDEIEYLRQVCKIDSEVVILTVNGLENERAYKEYFGI